MTISIVSNNCHCMHFIFKYISIVEVLLNFLSAVRNFIKKKPLTISYGPPEILQDVQSGWSSSPLTGKVNIKPSALYGEALTPTSHYYTTLEVILSMTMAIWISILTLNLILANMLSLLLHQQTFRKNLQTLSLQNYISALNRSYFLMTSLAPFRG